MRFPEWGHHVDAEVVEKDDARERHDEQITSRCAKKLAVTSTRSHAQLWWTGDAPGCLACLGAIPPVGLDQWDECLDASEPDRGLAGEST